MTRQMALGLVLAMVISSAAVDAQVGGLIRRKAGEIVGGKKPAPAPRPPAPAPASTDPAPATPATGGARKATPGKGEAAVSPLETSELPVTPVGQRDTAQQCHHAVERRLGTAALHPAGGRRRGLCAW